MATIATGVMMRIGTYDVATYEGRTQREVHPARRDESITYRITSDDYGVHHTTPDGEKWEHFKYTFHYRYLGRSLTVTWHCGITYGVPHPADGLRAAFNDVNTIAYEAFGVEWLEGYGYDSETEYKRAERVYKACERQDARLDAFFDSAESREAWESAVRED